MDNRKIILIGFNQYIEKLNSQSFTSQNALYDADIILFNATLFDYQREYRHTAFNSDGSLTYDGYQSIKAQEAHWKNAILKALKLGKTIFVYLPPPEEIFYIDSTNFSYDNDDVACIHSYGFLPFLLSGIVEEKGERIKLANSKSEFLEKHWETIHAWSSYELTIDMDTRYTLTNGIHLDTAACLITHTGDRPVGYLMQDKKNKGSIILLPTFELREAIRDNHQASGDCRKEFMESFVESIIETHKSLTHQTDVTPEPEWAKVPEFQLKQEEILKNDLTSKQQELGEVQQQISEIEKEIEEIRQLRGLLYETGKRLENAVLDALRVLGFEAESYIDENSQFDALFRSFEGVFIGEAEGRNSKAINIEKFRQLIGNLNEYDELHSADETPPAKGVLFGNAYRLSKVEEREVFFTTKCINTAQQRNIALVATTELFKIAQYINNHENSSYEKEYAKQCRIAIAEGSGIIEFPTPSPPKT